METVVRIIIILALAWLFSRAMAKWSMERPWMRVISIIILAQFFIFPKLVSMAWNFIGDSPQPPLQVVLGVCTLWVCVQCLVFMPRRIKPPERIKRLERLLQAYAVFVLALLALHPLFLDLATKARELDSNSNGDSLPRLIFFYGAWHLTLFAYGMGLAKWHRQGGRLTWRVLLPWASA